MNQKSDERGGSGIKIHWPITSNKHFKEALQDAADGKSPNNVSPCNYIFAQKKRRYGMVRRSGDGLHGKDQG